MLPVATDTLPTAISKINDVKTFLNNNEGSKFNALKAGRAAASAVTVTAGGKPYTFPDQASADAFKKEAGITK